MLVESLADVKQPALDRARMCRQAEHDYAGVPCGPMDQMTVAMAAPGHALLIDCSTQRAEPVPFSSGDVCILVIDSGVRHSLADGAYAETSPRVSTSGPGSWVSTPFATPRSGPGTGLSDVRLARRVRHVVTENRRTSHSAAGRQGKSMGRSRRADDR